MENHNERKQAILDLLMDDNSISVSEISKILQVSTVTIRSDLHGLEDGGLIVRTRGGALPVFHRSILNRQKVNIEEKTRIAKMAAALVSDGDTIMIEAGTTTALIARHLPGKQDVHVVTNSSLLLRYSRTNPLLNLILTGGEFRPMTESFVGSIARREVERFNVRYAFVGTDGFSVDNGLTTHLVEGAEIVRVMSSRAEKTVLVADSTKYGRAGFAAVLPLTDIDILITDDGIDSEAKRQVADLGIDVQIT
ncbi:MAG: DeoR/GlpR transcriptional regulator [Spirochaetales bacterium]|jgi:DeoR family transcriptional regulator, galactitol utilization operon repressor|nr:DeoR/GlpR transcriptional regulator [Spirochaetales bacterium]